MNVKSEPAVSSLVTQPEAPEAKHGSLMFPFPFGDTLSHTGVHCQGEMEPQEHES